MMCDVEVVRIDPLGPGLSSLPLTPGVTFGQIICVL